MALQRLTHGLGEPVGLRPDLQHEQRPERLGRAVHELRQVAARLEDPVYQREDLTRPPLGHE